ncbi:MAG: CoA-binding protein [Rhodobacteraceae bacterium]|nr:CoA-binding protein [Paracoccaceae bacterium]
MTETFPPAEPDDATLTRILSGMRCVAVVGVSDDPERPAHFVAADLHRRGIRVIPVNPNLVGQRLFGEDVLAGLEAVPADVPVDTVDIFRRPPDVPPVVDAALAHLPALRTIWMQVGIRHEEAAARARARGIAVVQDRCPKVEFPRLLGSPGQTIS